MAGSIVLVGAHIKVYINNKPYKLTQSLTLNVDYGEEEIRGIDVGYAQEIAGGVYSVKGSIAGLRVKNSGGLQGDNIRPLWVDILASPYISIRIQDRSTGEDIVFIPQAKVINENHIMATKTTYKMSFNFSGQTALFALDRS